MPKATTWVLVLALSATAHDRLDAATSAPRAMRQAEPDTAAHGAKAKTPDASPSPTPTPPPAPPAAEAAVLVAIDGVRWQEALGGTDPDVDGTVPVVGPEALTPVLHDLATKHGALIGAPGRGAIVASGPAYVSLPGYMEMLSGRPSHCPDNECGRIEAPTLVDDLVARGDDVAVFSSWERIDRAAAKRTNGFAISAGRSIARGVDAALLADGRDAEPYPGDGDFRPDRFTARAALAYLEARRPRFLFLGLGEPDEYAHRGDYAGYLASIHSADATVGELMDTLRRMGERGERTAVFVTTDHGRARSFRTHGGAWPESARVWLVAAGAGIHARGKVETPDTRALADIAPTLRVMLGLAQHPKTGAVLEELFVRP